MTAIQVCVNAIAKELVGRKVVQGEGYGSHPKIPPAMRAALKVLERTETDRCVEVIQGFARRGWKGTPTDIINAIRRTKSGKAKR